MHMKVPAKDRILAWAIGSSIVLHGVILTVHFTFPNALRWQAPDNRLEVVLVNAKTKERPSKADVLAQSNLDRGGNVDERRRARSPLPVTEPRDPGKDLAQAQKRVQELEARQQALLAQAREAQARAAAEAQKNPAPEQPRQSGRDMADLALAAMRLQAQIDRQLKEYQERPRKKFIGANAAEYRFAHYEEEWRARIERLGTVNYPAEARGKHYGNLRLTVTIRPDGSVESVELDRSSGLKVLDAAAFKIVKMAQPFAAFPPAIRKDTDLLVITRTWFFGRGDKLWTE